MHSFFKPSVSQREKEALDGILMGFELKVSHACAITDLGDEWVFALISSIHILLVYCIIGFICWVTLQHDTAAP